MSFESEVENIYERFEGVNRRLDINEINLIYFNKIKRKLINMIRDLRQDYIETIEVITMQDFKNVDLEYLRILCETEHIDMSYNINGYSAIVHAGYDLTHARDRVKNKYDCYERKLS